jgi:hypothetical protein
MGCMGLMLGVAVLWVVIELWGRHSRKKGAQRLTALVRHMYAGRHEYREADLARFRHLDLRFYDEAARVLEGERFVRLGDLEDVTSNEAPGGVGAPVFIRGLTGDEGRILAGIYHLRTLLRKTWQARLLGGAKPAKVVDFETELSDGTFLTTSNAASARGIDLPSKVLTDYLPSGCTPLEVLEAHRRRLADYLAEHPEAEVRRITTLQQGIDMAHRLQDLKAEHRKAKGGIVDQEELVSMANHMTAGTGEARLLAREIEKLREPEEGRDR